MTIRYNSKFATEKQYALHCLFSCFIGLSFKEEIEDKVSGYEIVLQDNRTLRIKDAFFEKISGKNYLLDENLPNENLTSINPFIEKETITFLYGETDILLGSDEIDVSGDIVASTFFMLTRWEEFVVKKRDGHKRFPASASVSYQLGFLHRPIVNEYVELLWAMLTHLGIKQERKKRKFQVIPTHDVDLPRLWWSFKGFAKSIAGDLIKRRSFGNALWSTTHYLKKQFSGKDPFDTFDYLMSLSEKNNLTSHFFFMSGGTTKNDNFYSIEHPLVKGLMADIDNRGHQIGYHPSYNAYNDAVQFSKEISLLQSLSPQQINTGRQHFLRFAAPDTWKVWEDNNMKWDSTLSYADQEGFRCGVCYPFPVFDFVNRRQLDLIERPLIVMDGSLVTYQDVTPEEGYNKVNSLLQEVKKYSGEFVFLWHNSAFNTPTWKKYQFIYERILNENPNHSRC